MAAEIGFEVRLTEPYQKALELTEAALKAEGYGVLTSIDVRATMKEKLDVDFLSYSILGVCNPPIAHRVLTQEAAVGLLLPCNITVEEESVNSSIVRIANPQVRSGVGSLDRNREISAVAQEAGAQLESVTEALESA